MHKPQVYIDLSGWSPKYFPPQLVQYANTQLKHKMLFGSDYPLDHAGPLARRFRAGRIQAGRAAADPQGERGEAPEAAGLNETQTTDGFSFRVTRRHQCAPGVGSKLPARAATAGRLGFCRRSAGSVCTVQIPDNASVEFVERAFSFAKERSPLAL